MFIRKLERGECPEHGRRCRTAKLIECGWCGEELVVHGNTFVRGFHPGECARRGGEALMDAAEEERKRRVRIQFMK